MKLGKEELGLYLAAYLLDRRFHRTYLTETAVDLALRSIIMVAKKSNITAGMIEAALIPEFNSYLSKSGTYSRTPRDRDTASTYWSKKHAASPLRCVAMRFARLKSSSANIERAFAALKFIQGPVRTNYSITTMRDLARIRIKENSDVMFDTEKDEYNDQSDDEDRSQRTTSSLAGSLSETSSQLWSSSFDYHSHASLSSEESRGRLIREFSDMFDFSLFNRETRSNSPALSCKTLDENEVDRLIHEARRIRNAQSQAHEAQAST